MITKDEEIGKLRTNLKHANESIDEKDVDIAKLKENLDTLKEQQVALEKSLEKEKAMALQEISRGKASAVQALQTEQEKRIEDINNSHEKEKNEVIIKIKEEMKEKLQLADREKQRALGKKRAFKKYDQFVLNTICLGVAPELFKGHEAKKMKSII